MAYQKPEPGLDKVVSDEAVDDYFRRIPLEMTEAPRRMWPTVLVALALCSTFSTVIGIVVRGGSQVTWLQVMFVACAIVTACAAVAWIESRAEGDEL